MDFTSPPDTGKEILAWQLDKYPDFVNMIRMDVCHPEQSFDFTLGKLRDKESRCSDIHACRLGKREHPIRAG